MRPPASTCALPRSLVALTSALVAVALLSGCLVEDGGERRSDAGGQVRAAPAASFPASDVLRRWDRARGRAFAEGDVDALRSLYAAGSAAGTSDVRLLRAYLRRGLRVEGMRMQLLSLEVLHEEPTRLRLLVTDRLTGSVAVGRGTRVRLPEDQASTRVVELRRTASGSDWQVEGVSSAPRPAAR